MKKRTGLLAFLPALGAALFIACSPPKYAHYTSVHNDFKCDVPWGWRVMTDNEADHYTDTNFIGSFEPSFFLGVPSFRVRWYSYNSAHRLPDGQLELYSTADDYVRQTLSGVYEPHRTMVREVQDKDINGRAAKYFVVSSPARVPANLKWGTVIDADTGVPYNVREHAYVVIPMSRGFYALIYPATKEGYSLYKEQWDKLALTFTVLKDGPDGPPAGAALPGASTAPKPAPAAKSKPKKK